MLTFDRLCESDRKSFILCSPQGNVSFRSAGRSSCLTGFHGRRYNTANELCYEIEIWGFRGCQNAVCGLLVSEGEGGTDRGSSNHFPMRHRLRLARNYDHSIAAVICKFAALVFRSENVVLWRETENEALTFCFGRDCTEESAEQVRTRRALIPEWEFCIFGLTNTSFARISYAVLWWRQLSYFSQVFLP